MKNEDAVAKLPTYCCIALTNSCCLRCRMCHKWKIGIAQMNRDELDLKQWENFIVSLRKLVKGRFQINFAGGEPLVKKEALELIKYAFIKEFDTHLSTNAFLIDAEMAKRIADAELTIITISLDSLKKECHDYIRGINSAYYKVMRAIELLDKYASDVRIGISTVIMDVNLDELGDIVRWVQADGRVDFMAFQAITQPFDTPEDPFWYKNEEYSYLYPSDISKVDRVISELIKMKQNGFYKLGNPLSQFYTYKAYFRDPNKFVKKQKCHIDMQTINITPTGDIQICCYMESIGNIKYDDINNVWFSKKAKILREKIGNCKKNCQSIVNCNYDEKELYLPEE